MEEYRKVVKNGKSKIPETTPQNEKFELPDGSRLFENMQDYFEYIIKKYEIQTDKSPIYKYCQSNVEQNYIQD